MRLYFQKEINGKPTYFSEKIWAGIANGLIGGFDIRPSFFIYENESIDYDLLYENTYIPKKHAIVSDKNDRFKRGVYIHFAMEILNLHQHLDVRGCKLLKLNG